MPWTSYVNVQVQHTFRFGAFTVTAFGQGFKLLNRQTVLDTDQGITVDYPGNANPDYGKATARQGPRSFRLGARASF